MKAFNLKRVPAPPPPPEPKVCVACKAFRAECVVPVGESSAPMCWLCAHHAVDHEVPPHLAATAECECLPHQIYPGREPPPVIAQDETLVLRLDQQKTSDIESVNFDIARGCITVVRIPSVSATVTTIAQGRARLEAP